MSDGTQPGGSPGYNPPPWTNDQGQPGGPQPSAPPPYPTSGQPYPGQPYGGQPVSGQPYGGQPYGGQPTSGQPYGGQPTSGQPYGGQPVSGQPPYGGQPVTGQPYGGQPVSGQPYGGQPYPGQPYPQVGQPLQGSPPPKKKTPLFVALGTAVVLVLACCGCFGYRFATSDDDTDPVSKGTTITTGAPGATEGAPQGGTPVSPAEYQAALTSADSSVAGAYTKLAKATTKSAANSAADEFASALEKARLILQPITPPSAATTWHLGLVNALASLRSDVENARAGKSACPGAAVLPSIRNTTGAARVRTAARNLAKDDFKVATWLPGTSKARTLSNGTFIKRANGGPSRLKITNNSTAVTISLVKKGSKSASTVVYVGPNKTFTVNGVVSGTYYIYMASGTDWDRNAKSFSRSCAYQKFDQSFKFTSTAAWQITLKKSAGGNASTSDVDPGTFPQ